MKYTKELLEPIVRECTSIRQVLQRLGLKETGGNYSNIGKRIDKHGIDRSHFTGQGHMKGKKALNRKSTKYYLDNKAHIHSNALRLRLLNEGYFEHQCQGCGAKEWRGDSIPLELHHIDCNHHNNSLDNLMILCPNCHKYEHDQLKKKSKNPKHKKKCKDCTEQIRKESLRCRSCASKLRPTKINWPDTKSLKKMVSETNYSVVARSLKVSDNAIRKRLRNH